MLPSGTAMRCWTRRLADAAPLVLLLGAAFFPGRAAAPRTTLYLVDRSASMLPGRPGAAQAARLLVEAEALRARPGDRLGVAVFGRGVELVLEPRAIDAVDFDALEQELGRRRPTLAAGTLLDERAAALVAHLDRISPLDEVRVVGDGELGAPVRLAPGGPPWSLLELRAPEPDDLAVLLDGLPLSSAPGAPLRVALRYAKRGALARREAVIELREGEALLARRALSGDGPPTGVIELRCLTPAAGAARFEARIVGPAPDEIPPNDRDLRTVYVQGTRRIGWYGAGPPPTEGSALLFAPLTPSSIAAELVHCDALWIDEVSADGLPAEAIAAFVARGGGLIVSGLERQLESGGYDQPPWSGLLPVEADRGRGVEEILVLLDASGSMDGARFAEALRALDALRTLWGAGPRVRAATFSTELSAWSELKPAGVPEALAARAIFGAVGPRGATHLARAVDATLAEPGAARRALFVLTDGREEDPSVGEPLAAARALAARAEVAGVRIHALAVGRDAEHGWLRALVGEGRVGTVQRVEGAAAIAEAMRRGLSAERVQRESARVVTGELPPGFPGAPAEVRAFRRAALRPGAAAPLRAESGEPLVALRAAERGRVLWVAGAVSGGGADAFTLPAEWLRALARWAAGPEGDPRLELSGASPRRVRYLLPEASSVDVQQGLLRSLWQPDDGSPRALDLLRTSARSFEGVLEDPRAGSLVVDGLAPRAVPEEAADEVSPFARRWRFLGHPGGPRQPREPGDGTSGSAWLVGALGLFALAFARWRRRSSPRPS